MSFPRETFRPYYDDRTTSDLWHRESERHGMELDRLEKLERCGPGYDLIPPAKEFPPAGQSYEEFWAETVKQRDEEWPKWWGAWKRKNNLQ